MGKIKLTNKVENREYHYFNMPLSDPELLDKVFNETFSTDAFMAKDIDDDRFRNAANVVYGMVNCPKTKSQVPKSQSSNFKTPKSQMTKLQKTKIPSKSEMVKPYVVNK